MKKTNYVKLKCQNIKQKHPPETERSSKERQEIQQISKVKAKRNDNINFHKTKRRKQKQKEAKSN